MFDIGWQELLLIGVVALVVIGPKDMPVAMRTAARMFAKLRGLSREFQHTVSEVMREAELDELRRKVQEAGHVNVKDGLANMVDPTGRMRDDLHNLHEFPDLADDLNRTQAQPKSATGGASADTAAAPAAELDAAPPAAEPPAAAADPGATPPPQTTASPATPASPSTTIGERRE